MTKDKLQKELLAKIREGIKPSDLKRPKRIIKPQVDDRRLSGFDKPDEGYESDSSDKSIPTPPPLPNNQIQELQTQVKFYSTTANNHLKNLQLAQAKISGLEEQVRELKTKRPDKTPSELLKEKNKQIEIIALENEKNLKRISELNKTIAHLEKHIKNPSENKAEPIGPQPTKTFSCSECQQTKPQSELSRVFGKFSFCLECSKQARHQAQKEKSKPQPLEFICHLCEKPKTEIPTLMKLDSTLQEYLVCLECKPLAKEFNEADLITDEL
ncbi:MAG TPA: hypothetical protein VIY47_10040 [Ignavibacteriaceae bacterium]